MSTRNHLNPTKRLVATCSRMLLAMTPVLTVALAPVVLPIGDAFAAKPKTTAINLQTNPPAAEVTILEPAPEKLLGVTPLSKAKLPQGAVKLRFRLSGYEDKIETVTIGKATTTFNYQLVRKIMPATLDLSSADAGGQGAEVIVDGEGKGNLPVKVQVPPGRHQIVVKKAGFVSWEKWADVTENQVITYEITLKAQEKPKGSLFVSSAPVGAEVKLNGAPKGKAPIAIENLEPGDYEVELTLDGHKTWKKNVSVKEGGKETLAGTLEANAAVTGGIKVFCDAPNAVITIDGVDIGPSPQVKEGLTPAEYRVSCKAPNYPEVAKTVKVEAGSPQAVELSPKKDVADKRGSISVESPVAGARAKVGDGEWRRTPARFEDLNPGKYLVQVEADGHAPWSETVTVEAKQVAEIKAELKAMGKIVVRAPGGKKADVYLNGNIVGTTPATIDVPVGAHKIKIVSKGFADEEYDVAVKPGDTSAVSAKLLPPPEPKIERRSNPTSAHVQDVGKGSLQLGATLLHPAEMTVSAGVIRGLEAGVQIRNLLHIITEFELQGQYQLVSTKAFALAVEAGVGGGLGASDRTSFTFQVKPMASLLLGEASSFTLYTQLRVYSDSLSKDFLADEKKAGRKVDASGLVMPIGLQGEFQIRESVNFWVKAEMEVANRDGRALYDELSDVINSRFRGGAGFSWLFN